MHPGSDDLAINMPMYLSLHNLLRPFIAKAVSCPGLDSVMVANQAMRIVWTSTV